MTTVAVLGGSGFLGARVVAAAVEQGLEVAAVARDTGSAPARFLAGAARVDRDLLDGAEALLDELRPERVILTAALARIDACERDPELARRTNAELPARVARWCRMHAARLVHVSTDLVFSGGNDGVPPPSAGYAEGDEPRPVTVYGATKAAGEREVLAEDPSALVVRLPLLFGDSGGRGQGASDWLLAAVERGERLRLFTDEWRTPLDVGDAARALLELAVQSLADNGGANGGATNTGATTRGLLHVAGPERLTRYELGSAALRGRGFDPDRLEAWIEPAVRADAGLAEQRAADVALDTRRARRLLSTPLRAPAEALSGPG